MGNVLGVPRAPSKEGLFLFMAILALGTALWDDGFMEKLPQVLILAAKRCQSQSTDQLGSLMCSQLSTAGDLAAALGKQ